MAFFNSMVLGKLLSSFTFVLRDLLCKCHRAVAVLCSGHQADDLVCSSGSGSVIEPWLRGVLAIIPMTLCVHLVVLLSAVFLSFLGLVMNL
jgi:hypothetical protein